MQVSVAVGHSLQLFVGVDETENLNLPLQHLFHLQECLPNGHHRHRTSLSRGIFFFIFGRSWD
jgi:hypothetical protein